MSEPYWTPLGGAPTQLGAPLVTALPGSPADGQEVVLTDSLTAPTYAWHLKYVAAKASNRWVFLGGPPLIADTATAETTASTTYANLSGGATGPAVTVPVAGDYDVAHGWTETAGPADTAALMSYDIGATPAVDVDAARTGAGFGNPPNGTQGRSKRKSLGAVTLTAKYRVTGGTARTFAERWLRVTPIAIGG